LPVSRAAPTRTRLSITKRAPARVRAGQVVRYRITVRNQGKATATDLQLTDKLPRQMSPVRKPKGVRLKKGTLTWTLGSLRAGGTKRVVLDLRLGSKATGRRCNSASARAANALRVSDRACSSVTGPHRARPR
jgi:uncharacterized repeat protein (TIGR01451 family)